jgi:hypothetical protein
VRCPSVAGLTCSLPMGMAAAALQRLNSSSKNPASSRPNTSATRPVRALGSPCFVTAVSAVRLEWSCREAAGGIPESAREPSPVYPAARVGTPADPNIPPGRESSWGQGSWIEVVEQNLVRAATARRKLRTELALTWCGLSAHCGLCTAASPPSPPSSPTASSASHRVRERGDDDVSDASVFQPAKRCAHSSRSSGARLRVCARCTVPQGALLAAETGGERRVVVVVLKRPFRDAHPIALTRC